MSERSIILDKINKKEKEIQGLEERLKAAKIYIQALKEVLGIMTDGPTQPSERREDRTVLRIGSAADSAREAIRTSGRPMHIDELMQALGRESNRRSRAALASALSAYVRNGEVFTRPSPNTFGLIEFGHIDARLDAPRRMPSLNFGKIEEEIDA